MFSDDGVRYAAHKNRSRQIFLKAFFFSGTYWQTFCFAGPDRKSLLSKTRMLTFIPQNCMVILEIMHSVSEKEHKQWKNKLHLLEILSKIVTSMETGNFSAHCQLNFPPVQNITVA